MKLTSETLCDARFSHTSGKLLFSRRTNQNEHNQLVWAMPKNNVSLYILCVNGFFLFCFRHVSVSFLNELILSRSTYYNNFRSHANEKLQIDFVNFQPTHIEQIHSY